MIICMAMYGDLIPIDPGYVVRAPLRTFYLIVAKHFTADFYVRGANDN